MGRVLAAKPIPGESAFIETLAARTKEVIADPEFELTTDGRTITFGGTGRFRGSTKVMMPCFLLRAPGPLDERLEAVLNSHGRRLQEYLSAAYGKAWPREGAEAHVCVTPSAVSLWWGGPDEASAIVRLRLISRAEVGL